VGTQLILDPGAILLSTVAGDVIKITASDVEVKGRGLIRLGATTGVLNAVLRISGSLSATTTLLTGSAAVGDLSVAVTSTAGFAVGDWVEISDTSYTYSKEYQRIKGIDALNVYLGGAVHKPYLVASAAKITKVNAVERVRVAGISLDGNGYQGTYMVLAEYTYDSAFVGIQNRNYYYHGLTVNNSSGIRVRGCSGVDGFSDFSTGIGAYGFTIGECSSHVTVSGGTYRNLRETNVTGGAHCVTVSGNSMHGLYGGGFVVHGRACTDITIIGNSIDGAVVPGGGTYVPGTNIKGITATWEDSGYLNHPDSRVVVSGNTISNFTGAGISCSFSTADNSHCSITGNKIYNCRGGGVAVNKAKGISIVGNIIVRNDVDTTGIGTTMIDLEFVTNITVSGNTLHWAAVLTGGTTLAVFLAAAVNVAITGNTVIHDGGAGTTAFEIESTAPGTSNNIRVTGNVSAGASIPCHVEANVQNISAQNNSFDTLSGSVVWNPGNLVDGAGETSADITVTQAALGDYVEFAAPYDLQGITTTAWVCAADKVHIRLQNETAGAIDLASGTWWVRVHKRYGT
jgi:hypothetical protein